MKRSILYSLILIMLACFKLTAQTEVHDVTELQSAVTAAADGAIITLADDFAFADATLTVPNLNVTIDGGDKVWSTGVIKISGAGTGTLTISNLKMDGTNAVNRLLVSHASNGILILNKMEFYNAAKGAVEISTSGNAKTEINYTKIYNNVGSVVGPAITLGENKTSNLTINNSTIENNSGTSGGYECGAVASKYFSGVLTINNTVFRKNENKAANTGPLGGGGGAMSMHYMYGKIFINECLFEENSTNGEGVEVKSTYDGGAIYIFDGQGDNAEISIDKTTFKNNLAYDDGGAILIQGKGGTKFKTTITNCTFYGNIAYGTTGANKSGGAIQFFRGGNSNTMTNVITSSTFVGNISGNKRTTLPQLGGAVGLSGGTTAAPLTRNNCLFIGNSVYGSNGQINYASNYKDVSNNSTTQAGTFNVINVDKGLDKDASSKKMKEILGVETPELADNSSPVFAGVEDEVVQTIMIKPGNIADNTYTGTVVAPDKDQRGFKRYKDQGAVEISSVKYDANGGSFELSPLTTYDGTEYYEPHTEDGEFKDKIITYYTVGANEGDTKVVDGGDAKLKAVHPDGKVFKGWSTDEDATDPDPIYTVGENLTYADDNLTLFAVWGEDDPLIYKVTYEPNGGSGTAKVIDSENDGTHKVLNYNATELAFTPPTPNHVLKEWNTAADGSGTAYAVGSTQTLTEDLTLYAQWEEKGTPPQPVVTVTYYPNGGNGTPKTINCAADGSHIILNYTDMPLDFTAPSDKHHFMGWNTAADGSGMNYFVGTTMYFSEDTDLYAKWSESSFPADPNAAIKITESGSFCPTNTTVVVSYELLYKDHPLDYIVEFSAAAQAVGFENTTTYTELPPHVILIPLPAGVPAGKYNGIILLRAPSGVSIQTEYPFEFEILNETMITTQPASVSGCKDDAFTLSVEAVGESLSYQWYREGEEIIGAVSNEYSNTMNSSTAGNYYVKISSLCGTVKSETVTVQANTLQILMKWDDVLYVDNQANRYTKFQWYKDGQAISKYGTSVYYTDTEGLSGSYSVRAYYTDDAYDESCPLVLSSTGTKASVKVYPNPVRRNSMLTVEGKSASADQGGFLIELYDLSGRLIVYRHSESELTTLPVNTASGVYLLHVTAPDGKKTVTKVVVK